MVKTVQIKKFMLIDNAYKERILKGKKITTIRYGKYDAKEGSEVYIVITPSDTAIAKAKIKGITKKKVRELTNEDAKRDGFKDVKELLRALNKIYGELYGDDEITIIEFEVIKQLKEGVPLKWLKGLNYRDPYEIAELYVENNLRVSPDIDLIVKKIHKESLKAAVKKYGPKRVRNALLKAYHELYDRGII